MAAEKKIGGKTYRVDKIPATTTIKLQLKIGKLLGGSFDHLPEIMKEASSKDGDKQTRADLHILSAIATAIATSDADEAVGLMQEICSLAQVQAQSGTYDSVDLDTHFNSENLQDLLTLIGFILKELFGPFFGALLSLGDQKTTPAS